MAWLIALGALAGLLLAVAIYDLLQRQHTILRNFPIIGHFRYALEAVGPELRQYIVTDNDEERPFTRDQRRWVYSTAKNENPYFGFGTDNRLETPDYVLIRQSPFPHENGTASTTPAKAACRTITSTAASWSGRSAPGISAVAPPTVDSTWNSSW